MFSWMGLLEASVAGGICIVLFFLASLFLGERYRTKYRKIIWLLIALRMCVPLHSFLIPQPVTVEMPIWVLGQRESSQTAEDGAFSYQKSTGEKDQANDGDVGEKNRYGNAAGAGLGSSIDSQDMMGLLWACGSAVVLIYYFTAHFLFCRRMMEKSRECNDERILTITDRAACEMGLKRMPQIRLIQDVQTGPFTVGFFRSIIFLPKSLYQERDLYYIIRHEMAHCAGRDPQMKLLLIIVNALHWFNPLAWLMKALADQDMELACDEKVLADTSREERSEYGEVLMSCIGTDRASRSVFSTGYVQGLKFVKKRFRNIFNTQKKSGRAAAGILAVLLAVASGMVGFEAGRTVYAGSGISIDRGIELRTDLTGDGAADIVRVYDDTYNLMTSVVLRSADGREAQFTYQEDLWASSWLIAGDLSRNGAADIVVMRYSNGMHGDGPVSVLYVAEESGILVWREYTKNFIPNPDIDSEQPATFDDIVCVGADIIEEEGVCLLRLVALDLEVLDDETVQYIDCSLSEGGWFIEKIQTVTNYLSGDSPVESPVEGMNQIPDEESENALPEKEDSKLSTDEAELERIVMIFSGAYFGGDTKEIEKYLTDSYLWDVDVFEGSPEDVRIHAIKGLENGKDKEVGDRFDVSVEFLESAEDDSYTYLTIEFVKTIEGWEIEFYGLEK